MQKQLYKSLSVFAIAAFVLYWIVNIQLSVFGRQRSFLGHGPFARAIAYRWRFFSPIPHSGNKVYFFVRYRNTPVMDSVELIEPLLAAKRKDAPFNQSDNIIEHLLFHAVGVIEEKVSGYNAKAREAMPGKPDSFYYRYSINQALQDRECMGQVAALKHYALIKYRYGSLQTALLEYKIVLKEQFVTSFEQRNDSILNPLVLTRFETPYKPFDQ
jgi:hypothetical protein